MTEMKDCSLHMTMSNFGTRLCGEFIEAEGEIVSTGNSSRKMVFEARKVIVPRTDISDSACDVLEEPVVVCRAAALVVPKNKQRKKRK